MIFPTVSKDENAEAAARTLVSEQEAPGPEKSDHGEAGGAYCSECLTMTADAVKIPSLPYVPSTTAPCPSVNRSGGAPSWTTDTDAFPSVSTKLRSSVCAFHFFEPGA